MEVVMLYPAIHRYRASLTTGIVNLVGIGRTWQRGRDRRCERRRPRWRRRRRRLPVLEPHIDALARHGLYVELRRRDRCPARLGLFPHRPHAALLQPREDEVAAAISHLGVDRRLLPLRPGVDDPSGQTNVQVIHLVAVDTAERFACGCRRRRVRRPKCRRRRRRRRRRKRRRRCRRKRRRRRRRRRCIFDDDHIIIVAVARHRLQVLVHSVGHARRIHRRVAGGIGMEVHSHVDTAANGQWPEIVPYEQIPHHVVMQRAGCDVAEAGIIEDVTQR